MDNRILIAEDEARLREVLCDYFQGQGFGGGRVL